jgi:hypothetical protein
MSIFCSRCGVELQPESKFCKACGYPVARQQGSMIEAEYRRPANLQYTQQPIQPRKPKRRTGLIISLIASGLALIAVIVFVIVPLVSEKQDKASGVLSPVVISIPGDNSKNGIVAGKQVFETEKTVSKAGGVITVDDEDSAVNGLIIDVAEDSYDKDTEFSISYSKIKSQGFDPGLKLISPLIHIDNGGEYSKNAMLVTVACAVPKDAIPAAFYYREEDKSLEYIPVMDYSENSVTMGLRHFSDTVIGYFESSYIEDKVSIDTGFIPGADDFSFQNKGSAITPRGNCFGQSIAEIWYYKNLKKTKGNLYGRYDNYTQNKEIDFSTKKFQYDDVLAYRLASCSQLLFVESPETKQIDWNISKWNAIRTSDQARFDQMVALMKFTGPQVLLIQSLDANKVAQSFHAIIAYKVEGNRIYVADPNKPGQKDRYVEIENGKFKPYSSADNAQQLDAGNAVNYNMFSDFGETAMYDHNKMRELWEELDDRSVGDDRFPDVEVNLIALVKNAQGDVEEKPIGEGYRSASKNLTFTVEIPNDMDKSVWFTNGKSEVARINPVDGKYTVQLEKGGGYIGVLLLKGNKWYGFEWVPVGLSEVTGIYDVTGSLQTDIHDKEPMTDFQVRVELNGTGMTITFLNSSTVLTGTYDEATGKFVGKDRKETDDVFAMTFWMFEDTTIIFNADSDPVTAAGKLEGNDEDADFLKSFKVEIALTKVSDLT